MAGNVWYHYTDKLIAFDEYKEYPNVHPDNGLTEIKPVGLWGSYYSGNESWLKYWGYYYPSDLKYCYRLVLNSMDKFCLLTNRSSILAFEKKYNINNGSWFWPNREHGTDVIIDWPKVKMDYSGILVKGYKDLYTETHPLVGKWYRTFSCDSVCIWDLKTIESFTLI